LWGISRSVPAVDVMKRYFVRPATFSDLDAVYPVIAKQNSQDYDEPLITIQDLSKAWQGMDLERTTCLAYADGKLAGYSELRDGDSPFIYLVDPHNVDLGFQLLTILEAVALSQTKGNIEFFARVSEKNWTLLKLFASYGYKTNLSFLIMEVDLSQPPDIPSWPAGICVRTFISNQDEQATYLVDEEASADKGYHQPLDFDAWARRMRLNDEIFDPSLWFLAHEENSTEIAGVALNLYHSESYTGWIDHLGVRRPWRNKGMGKALLLHSFSEFYRRGIQRIKLSVDSRSLTNSPRLYERVGMKTLQQYHIYTKQVVRDAGLA
jgi:GNAT superfamily N-acetyltransferase